MASSDIPDIDALHVQHLVTYLNNQLSGLWKINKNNLQFINEIQASDSEIHTLDQSMSPVCVLCLTSVSPTGSTLQNTISLLPNTFMAETRTTQCSTPNLTSLS